MTLAERLDKAIKDKGITPYKIEQEINVSRALIGKYLKGTEPSVNNILLLADYLDVPLDWLIRGDTHATNVGRDNISVGGSNSGVIGNSGTVSNVGGHNVSIAGDTKAKKIIDKDRIEIEIEQSVELYQQKIDSLEQRVKDLEALLEAKEEIIQMYKNK